MLDVLKIYLKSKDLDSDHILNDQPFHTWDAEMWIMSDMKKNTNFDRNPFIDSWTINWNMRKCIKLQIQFYNGYSKNH